MRLDFINRFVSERLCQLGNVLPWCIDHLGCGMEDENKSKDREKDSMIAFERGRLSRELWMKGSERKIQAQEGKVLSGPQDQGRKRKNVLNLTSRLRTHLDERRRAIALRKLSTDEWEGFARSRLRNGDE